MKMGPGFLQTIIKRVFVRPWWAHRDAVFDWWVSVDDECDAYRVQGGYIHGFGADGTYRHAETLIHAKPIKLALGSSYKGTVVDLVVHAMNEVLALLRPTNITDEMLSLSMQAIQDHGALGVLVDALLQDGTILEVPESMWDPTGEGARAFYSRQARTWAERHIRDRWMAA
jgi:hypothetical protein